MHDVQKLGLHLYTRLLGVLLLDDEPGQESVLHSLLVCIPVVIQHVV